MMYPELQPGGTNDPVEWVDRYGDTLYRFPLSREIRNRPKRWCRRPFWRPSRLGTSMPGRARKGLALGNP